MATKQVPTGHRRVRFLCNTNCQINGELAAVTKGQVEIVPSWIAEHLVHNGLAELVIEPSSSGS